MSIQVLEITINNHKNIRNNFRKSINTYINIDISIKLILTLIIVLTLIRIFRFHKYTYFHISLIYMKNTIILIYEYVKKTYVFQYNSTYIYIHE